MSNNDHTHDREQFGGFEPPKENWSKLPHLFINALPLVTSLGELKVILYTLRHTWGYQEYDGWKAITLDEFMNGRKRKDGARIDAGTGMSRNSIRAGIKSAVEHGFMQVTTDDSDAARIKNAYKLVSSNNLEGQKLTPRGSEVDPHLSEVDPRTEKETIERYQSNFVADATDEPKSKNGKGKVTIPSTLMNPMKDAIAAVFGWQFDTMTKNEIGMVQKTARELCTAGRVPEDVAVIYQYCKARFDMFKPTALTNHATDALNAKQAAVQRYEQPAEPEATPEQRQATIEAIRRAKEQLKEQTG